MEAVKQIKIELVIDVINPGHSDTTILRHMRRWLSEEEYKWAHTSNSYRVKETKVLVSDNTYETVTYR